jgi:hypothetical protein
MIALRFRVTSLDFSITTLQNYSAEDLRRNLILFYLGGKIQLKVTRKVTRKVTSNSVFRHYETNFFRQSQV